MAENQRALGVGLAVLVAACSASVPQGPTLNAMIPVEWQSAPGYSTESTPLTAWWVVSTRDCLNCESVEGVLRRLHYEKRSAVTLRAIHIGAPGEEQILERFLKTQRLDSPVMQVTSREHLESEAGEWPVPLLLLTRRDSLVWILAPGSSPVPNIPLADAVDSLSALVVAGH